MLSSSRRLAIFVVVLLWCGLVANGQTTNPPTTSEKLEGIPESEGRRIESAELGFGVLMPAAVTHWTERLGTDSSPVFHHTYIYQVPDNVYTLEVVGPFPHKTDADYQASLRLASDALKTNLEPKGYTFATLREFKLDVYPGREFSASDKTGMSGRAQVYVTPSFVYIVVGLNKSSSALIDRFFASLRISPK